ncbi:MAG: potassium transporter TrkG [Tunicatimonas sp.]|uniref:TrkH family potassium uptake protein n=1 Tax=Tunicatimonas sp. TaxID=1940096 RepID=UPI003C757D13
MPHNPVSNLPVRYRKHLLNVNSVIVQVAAVFGIGLIFYIYGFNHTDSIQSRLFRGSIAVLIVFVVGYLIRWVLSQEPHSFTINTRWEIIVLILAVLSIFLGLFRDSLFPLVFPIFNPAQIQLYSELLVSISLLLLVFFESSRALFRIAEVKIRPAAAFIISFLLLIAIGTGLLMLPAMTTLPDGLSAIDALFMAASASCVTGLSVINTATDLTFRGQVVILVLFQIGGLGILAFATFFTSLLNAEIGIRQAKMIPDYLDGQTLGYARPLLQRIILLTISIEAGTFLAMMYLWGDYPFRDWGERVFFSIFHAVSAFCNAGFTLFSSSYYEPTIRQMYVLHAVTAIAIVLGSLGFGPLNNIFSPQQLRQRLEKPWIDWRLSTKIAVNTTLLLLVVGAAGFYWLERSNTLAEMNLTESLISSFFQSATARTAGFNTVDISQITVPAMVLLMFLMFVGGSSGSTAGGIKTSTFFLLVASVVSTSRGSSQIEIGNRHISSEVVFKALSIFFYGIAINLIGVFILSISEPQLPLMDITFEQVSAFGTVGLSRGITASLSDVGKVVIIITMFLGRVGTLTFAIALSTRAISQNYKLPEEELMVG